MFSSRQPRSRRSRLRDLIWPRIGLRRSWQYLMYRLARVKLSPHRLALGFATGAFASFTPFIGLHILIAAVLAVVLRGSLLASAIGTAIGNPLTFPAIWLASYNLGALLLGKSVPSNFKLVLPQHSGGLMSGGIVAALAEAWNGLEPYLLPMVLGGIPLGLICGVLSYVAVYTAMTRIKTSRMARPSSQPPQ